MAVPTHAFHSLPNAIPSNAACCCSLLRPLLGSGRAACWLQRGRHRGASPPLAAPEERDRPVDRPAGRRRPHRRCADLASWGRRRQRCFCCRGHHLPQNVAEFPPTLLTPTQTTCCSTTGERWNWRWTFSGEQTGVVLRVAMLPAAAAARERTPVNCLVCAVSQASACLDASKLENALSTPPCPPPLPTCLQRAAVPGASPRRLPSGGRL